MNLPQTGQCKEGHFEKATADFNNNYNISYDFGSIMHSAGNRLESVLKGKKCLAFQ